VRPVNGSSAQRKPTYWISIRPMKNTGMETPATEIAMMKRSVRLPRLTAAERAERDADRNGDQHRADHQLDVGPMVSASSSITFLLEMIERPRSPRITRRMYSKNCTGSSGRARAPA
jgi:hypothetical protein